MAEALIALTADAGSRALINRGRDGTLAELALAPVTTVTPIPAALDQVRQMMRAVVTDPNGTAVSVPFPGVVYGKTGTAEYGTGNPLPTHAWFIGFRDTVAFAIIVEGGGFGAAVAAPIGSRFLASLGPSCILGNPAEIAVARPEHLTNPHSSATVNVVRNHRLVACSRS